VFVLDTNVISELRQGKPNQSPNVRAWAEYQAINHLFLSSITILELEKGVRILEKKTPPHGATLRIWLNEIYSAFSDRILPFTEHTAMICAALHIPNTYSKRDAMIASTAIEHRFTVVTRNIPDFLNINVKLLNPWLEESIESKLES